MAQVPDSNEPAVAEFCQTIKAGQQPVYVPVKTAADAKPSDCYFNVDAKIKAAGGSIEYGWALWHYPGKFIEAEHHAVWVSPEGDRVDVSPHTTGEQILFLPDPEMDYKEAFIPNRRKALCDDEQLIAFLRLAEQHDQLKIKNATPEGGYRETGEMMGIEMDMARLQMSLGLLPSEAEIEQSMQRVQVRELNPKERAERRRKQRKKEERRKRR
jgi:hypothetical protein